MAVTVTITESFPTTILCSITGNGSKNINKSQVLYHKTSESQTDEDARLALQTMIENNEKPV